ncbi:MAG: hypothetical protein CMF52_02530 [Legionellales bacterium]|nr:hypothetical protein [Legionellales bacterium]|tara:strand:- start:6532 stop:6978 length:447 start_codon:yes stop_codon:yes gene_type:complete
MIIRKAKEDDIEECVGLAVGMIKESWWKEAPFCSQKMRDYAYRALENDNKLYLVAEEDDQIYGFFAATLTETFFGHEIHAEQDLMYVKPENRKGMTGVKFLREYEIWARKNNAHHIYFAPTATQRRQWDALCQRLGYTYLGPAYGKRL